MKIIGRFLSADNREIIFLVRVSGIKKRHH